MFQMKPYADKPGAFGLFVHSFVSYERIGKWDEKRYKKGGRKPYFVELCGTPRRINLYRMSIIIMKREKMSLSEWSWTSSFFCTELHDRLADNVEFSAEVNLCLIVKIRNSLDSVYTR